MKNLFKLLFIIFSLVIFLFLEPPVLQAQQIDTTGYIQGYNKETVVLISNNFLNSQISSYEENNSQNFSGTSPLVINFEPYKDIYAKNIVPLKRSFIHNLSTDKQKVHPIRAP